MSDSETVTSASNSTLKRVRKLLSSRKYRHTEAAFILEGLKFVELLLDSEPNRMRIETLIISATVAGMDTGSDLIQRTRDARILEVADDLIERVGDVRTAQGVIAVVAFRPPETVQPPDRGAFLLLDSISDPGNMGTLIRTAVGVGMDGILLFGECVDIYNPKCVRATAGTLPFMPIREITEDVLDSFLDAGYDIFAAKMEADQDVFGVEFGNRSIVAVGNEAHGISSAVAARATSDIAIPLQPPCESLNAAIAGSLIMYLCRLSRHRYVD